MNLIEDIKANTELLEKIKGNDVYAQNLYAAICNNDFVKLDPWHILNGDYWACSWRTAGDYVAELREKGEHYLDYYCSGIVLHIDGFVSEGKVTNEILQDLNKIGWTVIKPDIVDS